MKIRPDEVEPSVVYTTMTRAITPRPIAWVSTVSENGIPNLAPFSYFNGVGTRPAALAFSAVNRSDGSPKDTVRNIEATGQFVVNVVSFENAKAMLGTADEIDYEVSEFEHAGVTPRPSTLVQPPSVAESKIQFECELLQNVVVGSGPIAANLIIGRILLIHVDDSALDERGRIDASLVDSIGRMGGRDYCRTIDQFEMQPDSK